MRMGGTAYDHSVSSEHAHRCSRQTHTHTLSLCLPRSPSRERSFSLSCNACARFLSFARSLPLSRCLSRSPLQQNLIKYGVLVRPSSILYLAKVPNVVLTMSIWIYIFVAYAIEMTHALVPRSVFFAVCVCVCVCVCVLVRVCVSGSRVRSVHVNLALRV